MVSKKILMNAIAGVASIAALGISTFAFAGGEFAPAPAPVAGCDMGNPNFYVGGRVGYGNNYWDNLDYEFATTFNGDIYRAVRHTKHTGFAGGVEIGYAFNKFLAIEAGFMGLPRAKVSHDVFRNGQPLVGTFNGFDLANLGYTQRSFNNYAFDISGKISIMFPGVDNVGLFAKAGVGFLQSNHKHHHHHYNDGFFAFNTVNVANTTFFYNPFNFYDNGEFGRHRNISNTNLTYGFGIFWNFTPNMTLDGRFQRWNGNPGAGYGIAQNRHGHQPYMDAYTIGLTYHIDGSGDLFNT